MLINNICVVPLKKYLLMLASFFGIKKEQFL
jgi:hypothetical protein